MSHGKRANFSTDLPAFFDGFRERTTGGFSRKKRKKKDFRAKAPSAPAKWRRIFDLKNTVERGDRELLLMPAAVVRWCLSLSAGLPPTGLQRRRRFAASAPICGPCSRGGDGDVDRASHVLEEKPDFYFP